MRVSRVDVLHVERTAGLPRAAKLGSQERYQEHSEFFEVIRCQKERLHRDHAFPAGLTARGSGLNANQDRNR